MSITVNHDDSFNLVTQTAIRRAFTTVLEAPVHPGEPGPDRSKRLFETYREALSAASPEAPDPRSARAIANDLADLFPEFWFSEPGTGISFIQYFDSQDGMIYEIRYQSA